MIRRSEISEGGDIVYVRELDGVHDMVDVAARRALMGQDELGNASITGDYIFTRTDSLNQAVDLAEHGWSEGADRIARICEAIEVDPALLKSALRIDTFWDVDGDEPDIDRFLQGDPENMITFVPEQMSHGRVLDFVVNVSQHAHVSAERIENRGAAILAAVETLRINGYSIGLTAVEQIGARNYGSDIARYQIPILEAGQSINVDTLAFSIVHPSFLRRLMFALNETEDDEFRKKFGISRGGGYGSPLLVVDFKLDHPTYVIDKDSGLSKTPEETSQFAQELVISALEAMSADSK